MDIIDRLQDEVLNRIELLEQQKGKHTEEIEKFKKKIEKAKEKEKSLEEHLKLAKEELTQLNKYLSWKSE
jgi:chromosome segregation ATPase